MESSRSRSTCAQEPLLTCIPLPQPELGPLTLITFTTASGYFFGNTKVCSIKGQPGVNASHRVSSPWNQTQTDLASQLDIQPCSQPNDSLPFIVAPPMVDTTKKTKMREDSVNPIPLLTQFLTTVFKFFSKTTLVSTTTATPTAAWEKGEI